MYIPKIFQNTDDDEIRSFIETRGFAILINHTDGRLWGTHIPLLLSSDGKKLTGHISKANPQAKSFRQTEEVLAIFSGPHAYISSSWYDHENVPTWNYIAVHVYGSLRIIEGDELIKSLADMVDKYEKGSASPVAVQRMSEPFLINHVRALTGFEMQISRVEAAYKLSQNRDRNNYKEIISKLNERGDYDSAAVANEMKKFSPFDHSNKA